MLTSIGRPGLGSLVFAGLAVAAIDPALTAGHGTKLLSFVGEAEPIVAALTKEDAALGNDADAIGQALRERGALTFLRYAVRKAKDGELEQAPSAKISVQARSIVRVEPYRTPLRIVPVE